MAGRNSEKDFWDIEDEEMLKAIEEHLRKREQES